MVMTYEYFSTIKTVYMIGIKGAGMVALAELLHTKGIVVSGSDVAERFFSDPILQKLHIPYAETFDPKNIPAKVDLVIYSTAYSAQNNAEVAAALERSLPMVSYPEALGLLMKEKFSIAVCGTHGKTTTTALAAHVLACGDKDPSAIVGSAVMGWNGGARVGKGQYFVVEADEYQNKFFHYHPMAAIVTNVDWDHPDFFPTFASYKDSFSHFLRRIPPHGFIIACGDDADVADVVRAAQCTVLTYGFSRECDFIISAPEQHREEGKIIQRFSVFHEGEKYGTFNLPLVGRHNMSNATAVIALAFKLGIPPAAVREGVETFRGTARRFEQRGTFEGATLIDDYAHHPAEIVATLTAAREAYPDRKIWAVFHPHTFSRTEALKEEFVQSFDSADYVLLLDIYPSARENGGTIGSGDLARAINAYVPQKAVHTPTIADAVELLRREVREGSVIITLGAGDVWRVHEYLTKIKNPDAMKESHDVKNTP